MRQKSSPLSDYNFVEDSDIITNIQKFRDKITNI